MSVRRIGLACALAAVGCHRDGGSAPVRDATPAVPVAAAARDASVDAGVRADVVVPHDTAPSAVLTIRVVNVSSQPLPLMTNPDTNEVLHTRHLFARRQPDAATYAASEGELVKFFTVGQEPLCSADGGAGYGGLGQTGQRTLAPGEAIEFAWDGQRRREVIDTQRGGACVAVGAPDPGRYRFEFDQPYNAPVCNRVIVTLPLAADASHTVEIRCTPHPPGQHGEEE